MNCAEPFWTSFRVCRQPEPSRRSTPRLAGLAVWSGCRCSNCFFFCCFVWTSVAGRVVQSRPRSCVRSYSHARVRTRDPEAALCRNAFPGKTGPSLGPSANCHDCLSTCPAVHAHTYTHTAQAAVAHSQHRILQPGLVFQDV